MLINETNIIPAVSYFYCIFYCYLFITIYYIFIFLCVILQPRTIHIGLCLPSSCSIDEIEYLTKQSQTVLDRRDVQILTIRSPTQRYYNYWNDRTFIILL